MPAPAKKYRDKFRDPDPDSDPEPKKESINQKTRKQKS
jgi:hypothetical protein